MRIVTLTATVALLTACSSERASFDYQSTLERNTRGLVLHEDGSVGHAGMLGTNCPFETERGSVTGDYNLPDEGEEVVDSGDLIGENTVLLLLGDDAHLLDKSTGTYTHETVTFEGLVDAQLMTGGMVALTERDGACALAWSGTDTAHGAPCGRLDVDPATGVALLTHERGLSLVDVDSGARALATGTLGVLDHVAQAAYAVEGSEVFAYELDGVPRWSTALDGEVIAMAEAGATGAAAVLVGFEDGSGELAYLDGETGAIQARVHTPGWADELTVSADGSTVALIRGYDTHFYRVSDEWRE